MKDEICEAFCGAITVREVPVGLAVGTAFRGEDGDTIGFYVIRDPGNRDRIRIEDDGMTIPMLEASGVDISEGPRAEAFAGLLAEHGVEHAGQAPHLR